MCWRTTTAAQVREGKNYDASRFPQTGNCVCYKNTRAQSGRISLQSTEINFYSNMQTVQGEMTLHGMTVTVGNDCGNSDYCWKNHINKKKNQCIQHLKFLSSRHQRVNPCLRKVFKWTCCSLTNLELNIWDWEGNLILFLVILIQTENGQNLMCI